MLRMAAHAARTFSESTHHATTAIPGTDEGRGSLMIHVLRNSVRCVMLVLLWPLLWLQARHVYRVTPRLPEAHGQRCGTQGQGPVCRVLLAGDSGAAGVGVSTQEEALCGQLVQSLGQHFTVEWQVLAVNGLDSVGLVALLQELPPLAWDVVVLSIGANDVTRLCSPRRWVQWQDQLADLVQTRFSAGLLVHSAVPPMHACTALPQPLRWFMGTWAREMNRLLARLLAAQAGRTLHRHPASTTSIGMSVDGFHPSAQGYSAWANTLSQHILAHHVR